MFKFALIVAVVYGLIVAIAFLSQRSMLYLPNIPGRELTASPADIGLDYEDVFIETDDGVTLHGWYIGAPSSRVLLFFHGNAGNISHRLASIRQFAEPRPVDTDHRLPGLWRKRRPGQRSRPATGCRSRLALSHRDP